MTKLKYILKIRDGPRKSAIKRSDEEKEEMIREALKKKGKASGMDVAGFTGLDSSHVYRILNSMPDVDFTIAPSQNRYSTKKKLHTKKEVKLYFLKTPA